MQVLNDLAQRRGLCAAQALRDEVTIQVPDRQPVGFDIQLRVILHLAPADGIDVGDQVAAHAIGIDQLEDARLFVNHIAAALFA